MGIGIIEPRRRRPYYIVCMDGLGDGIYHRPFVKMLSTRYDVYLRTPWPELYSDLKIHFVKSPVALRTQQKNVARQNPALWRPTPRGPRELKIRYSKHDLLSMNMVKSLERQYPHANGTYHMDLPVFGRAPISSDKPLALIRPATLRREWLAPARNPAAEYIQEAIDLLRAEGFAIVSVADCDGTQEWFDGPEPSGLDFTFHRGELNVSQLLALVQASAVLVGGVGWIVPAAVAAKKPLFIVFGGRGGHNAPEKIFDPRMDLSRVGWAIPDPFCRCVEAKHDCNKRIQAFGEKFGQWLTKVNLARRIRDGVLSAEPELEPAL